MIRSLVCVTCLRTMISIIIWICTLIVFRTHLDCSSSTLTCFGLHEIHKQMIERHTQISRQKVSKTHKTIFFIQVQKCDIERGTISRLKKNVSPFRFH